MPNEILSTRRLLELMRDLQRCATERQAAEERIAAERAGAEAAAAQQRSEAVQLAEDRYAQRKAEADDAAAREKGKLESEYESARSGAQQEYHGLRTAAELDRRKTSAEAQQRQKDEALVILSTFDAQKDEPRRRLEGFGVELKKRRQELVAIEHDAGEILRSRQLPTPAESATAVRNEGVAEGPTGDSDEAVTDASQLVLDKVEAVRAAGQSLYDEPLSKLLEVGPTSGIAFTAALVVGAATGLPTGWSPIPMVVGGVVGAVAAWLATWFGVRPIARRRSEATTEQLRLAQADALAADRPVVKYALASVFGAFCGLMSMTAMIVDVSQPLSGAGAYAWILYWAPSLFLLCLGVHLFAYGPDRGVGRLLTHGVFIGLLYAVAVYLTAYQVFDLLGIPRSQLEGAAIYYGIISFWTGLFVSTAVIYLHKRQRDYRLRAEEEADLEASRLTALAGGGDEPAVVRS